MNLAISVFFVVFLAAFPAWAGMFSGVGGVLTSIFQSIIEDLALPATLVSAAWAVLAWFFRLGGIVIAISVCLGGVLLLNIETIVTSFMAHAH